MVQVQEDAIVDELLGQVVVSLVAPGILSLILPPTHDYQGFVYILIVTISCFVLWQWKNPEGRAGWLGLLNLQTIMPRTSVNSLSFFIALEVLAIFLSYLDPMISSSPAGLNLTDASFMTTFGVIYLCCIVGVIFIRGVGNVLIVMYFVVGFLCPSGDIRTVF